MDKRTDECPWREKKTEFLCEMSDASRKIFEFLARIHYSEFFIGPTGPSSAYRAPRRKRRIVQNVGEPRPRAASEPLLSRPRYRSPGSYLRETWRRQKNGGPQVLTRASLRNSHYYSPWNSSTRGNAMRRGSRCTGATDRSLPSLGKAFSSFMASSSSSSSPSSPSPSHFSLFLTSRFYSLRPAVYLRSAS